MSKERNANIELLRNMAMFFIVVLHLLGKTSAIDELAKDSGIYFLTWTVSAVCRMGNNLFIIISGYFYREAQFKVDKFIKLWFQVLFYSVTMAVIAKVIFGLELLSGWRNVLFPVIRGEYWFITIYLALYCLMPYIKKLIDQLIPEMYMKLLLFGFVALSFIPTFFSKGFLNSGGAYGIVWFIYLYLVGAYVRENETQIRNRLGEGKKKWLVCFIILILPVYKVGLEYLKTFSIGHYIADAWAETLYQSNSPIVLLASVFFFICFTTSKSAGGNGAKIVNFIGKGCVGVYLIHNNRNLAHFLWESLRINYWLVERENLPVILLIALLVFVACNLIDHLREYIFGVLRINKLIVKTSDIILDNWGRITTKWL